MDRERSLVVSAPSERDVYSLRSVMRANAWSGAATVSAGALARKSHAKPGQVGILREALRASRSKRARASATAAIYCVFNRPSLYIGGASIMAEQQSRPLNIVCFATFFKGGDFIRECHARGANVILITKEKMLEEDWPRDVLADLFAVPNEAPVELFLDLVSHIAQTRRVDRIIALEEFDVVIAALAREHLVLNGMRSVTPKTFRDNLSIRYSARAARLPLPPLSAAVNKEEMADYMNRV